MTEIFSKDHLKDVMTSISERYIDVSGSHPLRNIIENSQLLQSISDLCLQGKYKYSPYREKLFLKGRGKPPREISIPTYKDQSILKCLDNSLKSYCPISNSTQVASFLVKDIKNFLALTENLINVSIIRLDIIGYFDNINHSILFKKMRAKNCPDWLIRLAQNAITNPTKTQYSSEREKRQIGIPQGISIASHLADLYLEEFDQECKKRCLQYYRYVDDILLFTPSTEKDTILDFIKSCLDQLELQFHRDGGKFQVGDALSEAGFNYLGYEFYPNRECISVRQSSVQKFINSTVGIITRYKKGGYFRKYRSAENARTAFIFDLNEKITGAYSNDKRYGWLWYFQEMNDVGLLTHIDNIIQRELSRSERTKNIRPKKLKRTFYEILHKGKNSKYILNYGSQDLNYMKKVLSDIGEDLSFLQDEQIPHMFKWVTNKRIRKLELDEVRHS